MKSDYQHILEEIYRVIKDQPDEGSVAQYIPELSIIDPGKFGVHLSTLNGEHYGVGDYKEKFSIQSIAKVLSLTLVFQHLGEDLWKRIGVEPSGNPFNSLWQLEMEKGIPRNPLINAGAIVLADILCSLHADPKSVFIEFVREISGIQSINYNNQVAASEKNLGFRNAALFNMMKASGNIKNEIEAVLDLYYHQCSVEMTCEEMATAFLLYANRGKMISGDKQIITSSMTKRINAIMQTCGFYDEAGEFSF